jgi:hypothetical protein
MGGSMKISEQNLRDAEQAVRKYLDRQPPNSKMVAKFAAIDLVMMACGLLNRKTGIQYTDYLIAAGRLKFDGYWIRVDV